MSDKLQTEHASRNGQRTFDSLFEASLDALFIIDGPTQKILRANHAAGYILGYDQDYFIGKDYHDFLPESQDPEVRAGGYAPDERRFIGSAIVTQGLLRADGSVCPMEMTVSFIPWGSGQAMLANFRDITERRKAEERIAYLAFHDPLTDLANRTLLYDRLMQSLMEARRRDRKLAVLFVDLDRFRSINDSLGIAVGDGVLQTVSARIRRLLRPEDTAARLGGDDFVIVLEDADAPRVDGIARRLITEIKLPMNVSSHELFLTGTVGIALYPEDDEDAEGLIKASGLAMQTARDAGGDGFGYFTESQRQHAHERVGIEIDLRRALDDLDQFKVFYQPRVDVHGGVVGMEALVRWEHPTRGMISPAAFIPVAENSGLILEIGRHVLRTACRENRRWREMGLPLSVSVNMSARQLLRRDFAREVQATLEETGLEPEGLELEITETLLMSPGPDVYGRLTELRELGVRIALDDFGTGYSSLSYLKQFPIDTLKMDRAFVMDVHRDPGNRAIAQTIVSLSRILEIRVVAEGVETQEQRVELQALGCDEFQGYLFGKPMPAQEFEASARAGAPD